MRIRELKLIRYGKFSDRTLALPFKDRDIHLIVGPNEAGKSTFRTAIGDWLFGIPMRTPLAFLHPMPELRIGGVIERRGSGTAGGEELAFDRTKGNKNTLRTPTDAPLLDGALQAAPLGGPPHGSEVVDAHRSRRGLALLRPEADEPRGAPRGLGAGVDAVLLVFVDVAALHADEEFQLDPDRRILAAQFHAARARAPEDRGRRAAVPLGRGGGGGCADGARGDGIR